MPTTKTGYWVQVKDGQVKQVWDYEPPAEKKASEGGWVEAVEIHPDITDGREVYDGHSFDVNATPVEIIWAKRTLTIDERKGVLKGQARAVMNETVRTETDKELDEDPNTVADLDAITAARTAYQNECTAIDALTTHEAIDSYGA
jgi:hypothetical protein